jgi:glucose-1-phosphate cytidylyltransferase
MAMASAMWTSPPSRTSPGDGAWISGGFFVGEPAILDYIEGDETVWELDPVARLAHEGQIRARRHTGFWHPMDTLRDKAVLNQLWEGGSPPWKTWSGT